MKREAPEGHGAAIDVFIVGRPEPVRLSRVETSKDPSFGWVFLADEVDSPTAEPDDRLLFVPEHYIERIEVHFVRSAESRVVGFSYGTIETKE